MMPNHVHAIIVLGVDAVDAGSIVRRHALPEILRAFKTFPARRINERRRTPGTAVWQRNYYEHIIRTAGSLHRIRADIANNPLRWEMDREIRLWPPTGSADRRAPGGGLDSTGTFCREGRRHLTMVPIPFILRQVGSAG